MDQYALYICALVLEIVGEVPLVVVALALLETNDCSNSPIIRYSSKDYFMIFKNI